MSEDDAAAIVREAAAAHGWKPAPVNAENAVDAAVRDAEVLFEADAPALVGQCRDSLFAATRVYASGVAPGTVLAEVQIVRYQPGGRYVDHRDSPAPGATPRALSIVCYLNDDFTGGDTVFIEPHQIVAPAPGVAVVFAPELLHRAEPVHAGTKYVITAWYHVPPSART